eukprot:7380164-Alexandrium_andersonii.AAC.1
MPLQPPEGVSMSEWAAAAAPLIDAAFVGAGPTIQLAVDSGDTDTAWKLWSRTMEGALVQSCKPEQHGLPLR